MRTGLLPAGEPGVFAPMLRSRVADAMRRGEPVTAFGLADGETACGAVAGFLATGRFRIASLFVAPKYRQKGGGRQLVYALRDALTGLDAAEGLEISFTAISEEGRTLLSFLPAVGFAQRTYSGADIYVTTLGEMAALPFFADAKKKAAALAELKADEIVALERLARAAEAPLPEGGFAAKGVDRDVSAAVKEAGAFNNFIVADHSVGGMLTVAGLWSGSENPALLPTLLRSAFARAREKYAPETPLAFQTVTPASARIVQSLLPDARRVSYTYEMPLDR